MRFWNRSDGSELEDRLRSERPAPRPEFLRAVASRIEARRPRISLGLRLAFASALTLTMLVAVASVGGVSYAASGAKKAVVSVGEALSVSSNAAKPAKAENAADKQHLKDCKDAVKQNEKAQKERHKALAGADTQAERDAENARHKAAMDALKERKKDCKD